MPKDHDAQDVDHYNAEETLLSTFTRKHPALVFVGSVMLYVLSGFMLGWFLHWYIDPSTAATPSTAKKDIVQAVALVSAGLAGIIGVYFTWRNLNQSRENVQEQLKQARKDQAATQQSTQEALNLTQKGQITERFTRAIDQLGKADNGTPRRAIRLGGIYALERIAREAADEYHWPIMEVLTAYLGQHASWQPTDRINDPQADIQAILNVIGSRARYYGKGEDKRLNLRELDLSRCVLNEAHLEGADLRDTHFESAGLENAHLEGADLEGAHLEGARLEGAHLEGTLLGETHLTRAALRGADLRDAVDLSPDMLERANGDLTTILPEGLEPPSWWSTLPTALEPLHRQEYSIKVSKVPLRFSGRDNWYALPNLPNTLYVSPTGISTLSTAGSLLSFNHVRWVSAPQMPSEEYSFKPAPADMVDWFRNHPYMRAENLTEIEVGGVPGAQFDVVVSSIPDGSPPGSGRARIPLFPSGPRKGAFYLVEGNKNRIILLTVDGENITIVIESMPDEFERFLAETKELLDTVSWGPPAVGTKRNL